MLISVSSLVVGSLLATSHPPLTPLRSSLSLSERRAYTDAVLCLQKLPALTPPSIMPGAKSRFDDFVGTHINQTLRIHSTGNFLAWHRSFVWSYGPALRRECGYTGHQPYWNWGKYARDPANSPLFDGSEYSLGGDGEHVECPGTSVPGDPGFWLHHAQIDLVWWIWQNQDLATRRDAMVGSTSMFPGGRECDAGR